MEEEGEKQWGCGVSAQASGSGQGWGEGGERATSSLLLGSPGLHVRNIPNSDLV